MERSIGQNQPQKSETLGDIANEYLESKRSSLRTTLIWGGIRASTTAGAVILVATHGSIDTPVIGQSFRVIYDVSDTFGVHFTPDQLTSIMKKSLPIFGYLNARSVLSYYLQRRNLIKLNQRIENAQNANQ